MIRSKRRVASHARDNAFAFVCSRSECDTCLSSETTSSLSTKGQLQFAWEKTVADASLNADPVFMRCV